MRAKAAEVVHTVVQNNPQSQQNVMDCKGMEALMHNAAHDEDSTSRAKALGAVGGESLRTEWNVLSLTASVHLTMFRECSTETAVYDKSKKSRAKVLAQ